MTIELIRTLGILVLVIMAISALVGLTLLLLSARRISQLNIPPDANFVETLHYTPLFVVMAIDLLDLGLDFLAAPLSWAILDRLGLKALRGVAAAEALIPGTQLIPTLTLCWFGVRMLGIRY
jgi:hypothetical protein